VLAVVAPRTEHGEIRAALIRRNPMVHPSVRRGDYPWWCLVFAARPALALALPAPLRRRRRRMRR
jgi:hypothetical protein